MLYASIPELQRWNRWSFEMETLFHHTLFNGCNYLSTTWLKLIHVSLLKAAPDDNVVRNVQSIDHWYMFQNTLTLKVESPKYMDYQLYRNTCRLGLMNETTLLSGQWARAFHNNAVIWYYTCAFKWLTFWNYIIASPSLLHTAMLNITSVYYLKSTQASASPHDQKYVYVDLGAAF